MNPLFEHAPCSLALAVAFHGVATPEDEARLLRDEDLHRRFSTAARRHAVDAFGADRILPLGEGRSRGILEACT